MSKGLEAFKKLRKYVNPIYGRNLFAQYQEAMKNAELVEKSLKALEIIKEKEVSLMRLRLTKNYKHYNLIYFDRKKLSEEEYNLLKGVL